MDRLICTSEAVLRGEGLWGDQDFQLSPALHAKYWPGFFYALNAPNFRLVMDIGLYC